MSRFRLALVVGSCGLFWTLLGAVFGALARHPLGGLILGGLLGIAYVLLSLAAAEKFPLDAWEAAILENSAAPELYEMLRRLCETTGLDLPTLYVFPHPTPNAFVVVGREGGAVVAISQDFFGHFDEDEAQAVLALAVARLATDAMPAWTVAATLAGLPLHGALALRRRPGLDWLGAALFALCGWPAAALLRLAWEEKVVTAADYHAAHLADRPGALESALTKMETTKARDGLGVGSPATALLFAVSPLPAGGADAPAWQRALAAFPSRRPDVAERAARFLGPPPALPAEPPASLRG